MAIAKYSPTSNNSVVKPDIKAYDTALVDEEETPLDSLIQYIEGSKWEVTYYSQMLGGDEGVQTIDEFLPDVLQQYTEIKEFILHVTSPLDSSVYDNQNSMTATGTALYYNQITPNVGDLFIAGLLDNRLGLFTIQSIVRKSINKESVFEINYIITSILVPGDSKLIDLSEKTIKTYYYSSDNYFNNISPLLTVNEYSTKLSLEEVYKDVVDLYVNEMLDAETKMFKIPGQSFRVYDYVLAEFLNKIMRTTDNENIKSISRHSIIDTYLKQITIWDVLIEQDVDLLNHCNRELKPTSLVGLKLNEGFRKLIYRGFDYCVYPSKPDGTTDTAFSTPAQSFVLFESTGANIKNLSVSFTNLNQGLLTIPTVDTLTTYVFSPEFYDQGSNLTVIETLVLSYLRKESIDIEMLKRLMDSYRKWNRLEQFYYCPVLMLLLRYASETRASKV